MRKITIKNLRYSYSRDSGPHKAILDSIDLSIDEGQFVVLLGESGCGKTTLLKLIGGLLQPPAGSVIIDGEIVTTPHPSRSFVFQHPSLLPWLNVKDNISFGCKVRKDVDNLQQRVYESIRMIGLEGFENNYPSSLSAGMIQRVTIARSLIGKPDVILLDEPFGSLDFNNRKHLQNQIKILWRSLGFTAVFVTHDIEEAIILGEKIIILGDTPTRIVHEIMIDRSKGLNLTLREQSDLKTEIQNKLISIQEKKEGLRGEKHE